MAEQVEIGIIGGTGLYQMEGFTDVKEVALSGGCLKWR
jgi:purine nucleoside phosphorylase